MREIQPEYKRDMNHNYLILPAEREIDTDSYQVRMIVGNVVPCLLKCRIQGIDGKCMVYYEITSRQSVEALYEKKKMKIEDLQIIFGGFVHAMEEMSEHLLNPGQLLIQPEYMYMDVEKGEIGFCCMPGYQKEIREQFQTLAEYVLPRLDHEDAKAVMLGYGVYRRALEDTFHLEHIKEELYGIRRGNNDPAGFSDKTSKSGEIRQNVFNADWEEDKDGIREPGSEGNWLKFPGDEKMQKMPVDRSIREEPKSRRRKTGKRSAIFFAASFIFLAMAIATFLGYLPEVETSVILGSVLVFMSVGMAVSLILKKMGRKDEGKKLRGKETVFPEYGEKVPVEDPDIKRTEEKTGSRTFTEVSDVPQENSELFGETVVLSSNPGPGPASLVSREPGELATIYLRDDITVIGKLETAADAVIPVMTVSRLHAKIRKKEENFFLSDLNSRNGTTVNGRLLQGDEEYQLQNEDEVDFAQARYIFLK